MICRGTLSHLQCNPDITQLTFWIEELDREFTASLPSEKWIDKCIVFIEKNRVARFVIDLGESLHE